MVLTPIVLLQLADELSFGLAQGGGIEAVRAGFLLAVLVASGAAARRWGRVTTLALGGVLLGAGLLAYSAAPAYWIVLVAMALVGIGGGILEALINPLVQDEHPDDSGRYLNVVNAFFSLGVVATVLASGELLSRGVSWRLVVAGVALVAIASGALFAICGRRSRTGRTVAARRVRDTGRRVGTAPEERGPGTLDHARQIVRQPVFWLFGLAIFCGGGAEGGFTFWSASYIQIHFDTMARAGGIGTAVFAGGAAW
jgi:MFS family permease